MRPRYVELLADALKIEPSPTDYLADIDGGFYVTEYLRSWAFEAQLRDYLQREVRQRLVREARARAGSCASCGRSASATRADELLEDVTGSTLEMEAVAERVREVLPAEPLAAPPLVGTVARPCIVHLSMDRTES